MIVEQRVTPEPPQDVTENAANGANRSGVRFVPNRQLNLKGQVREVMRFFHYAARTEETYWHWIERFLRFHRPVVAMAAGGGKVWGWREPESMGAALSDPALSSFSELAVGPTAPFPGRPWASRASR